MSLPYSHILVTGGAGFIGSHFIRLLLGEEAGVRVTNVDKLTYAGNPANLREVAWEPRYRFVRADIAGGRVREVMRENPPDAIVNFAAETHVDRSITAPQAFVHTDVLGVQNLLEGAREVGVRRFVQVSTDEVYGSIAEGYADEEAPILPSSPYAASKAGGELLVFAAFRTYGTPALVCRGSNTYGPNQYPEKLIPLAVTNLLSGLPVPVYGDGRQCRDWLYVTDHCRGILTVLRAGIPGEAYNIAGGEEYENLATIERLLDLLGAPRDCLRFIADRPGHDRRYAMRSDKLRRLGWVPQTALPDGLAQCVAWYRDNPAWWQGIRRRKAFTAYYARQYPALQ